MENKTLDQLIDMYRNRKVDKDFSVKYRTNYFYIKDKEPYQATIIIRANKIVPYIEPDGTVLYHTMARLVVDDVETLLNLFSSLSAKTTDVDKFTTSGYTFISGTAFTQVRNASKELADNYRRLASLQDTKIAYYDALIEKFPEQLL